MFAILIFFLTLMGIAAYHRHKTPIAFTGLALALVVALFREGGTQLAQDIGHEIPVLAHLVALLVGFAFLAAAFERSNIGNQATRWLPNDWIGGLAILMGVFALSGVIDNIAAALIGISLAKQVYDQKVSLIFAGAVVAVANAGGAGSVIGDTTTTMIWIAGKATPLELLWAYLPASVMAISLGTYAARKQHAFQPIQKDPLASHGQIRWGYIGIVGAMLIAVVIANLAIEGFPAIGAWVVLALAFFAQPGILDWRKIGAHATPDALFLAALVAQASLVPVNDLPDPTWAKTVGLGFVSSIFDNIPLTALAIKQGGYDWWILAFAVGEGGSMMWFGSSAGVAVSQEVEGMQDTGRYLREVSVPIALCYLIAMLLTWPLAS